MTELRFFVPGIPGPAGSKRGFAIKKGGVYTGRIAMIDAGGQRTKDWRANVATAAFHAMHEADLAPFGGAVETEMIFQMPRPKYHYRSDKVTLGPKAERFHVKTPDAGKLARGTQDALKGIVWRDDCQIVKETHEKAYSEQPGAWIVVREAGK